MSKFVYAMKVILFLALAACAAPPPPTAEPTRLAPATIMPSPSSTSSPLPAITTTPTRTSPTATPTASATQISRTASIKEIVNQVDARPSADKTFSLATLGQLLNLGGQARTGNNSKARLDFTEGTIVRLGQNTILTVEELAAPNGNPFTRLQFEAGKIWISLFGGSMEIKTPVGIATVRGSFGSVEYVNGILIFTCYEGVCGFEGNVLGNLQQITRNPNGEIGRTSLPLSAVNEFCQNNPDTCAALIRALGTGAPTPEPIIPGREPREPKEPGPPQPPSPPCTNKRGC